MRQYGRVVFVDAAVAFSPRVFLSITHAKTRSSYIPLSLFPVIASLAAVKVLAHTLQPTNDGSEETNRGLSREEETQGAKQTAERR